MCHHVRKKCTPRATLPSGGLHIFGSSANSGIEKTAPAARIQGSEGPQVLETRQFAPTHGTAHHRPSAYDAQPAGFVSNDTGPTESPSKPLPDQGATRIRFPKFADEPIKRVRTNRTAIAGERFSSAKPDRFLIPHQS